MTSAGKWEIAPPILQEKYSLLDAVVVGGLDVLEAYDKGGAKAAKKQAIVTGGGVLGGIAGGAATGAAVGSVVPGIGTAIGTVIGGIVGWWAGEKAASTLV